MSNPAIRAFTRIKKHWLGASDGL